MTSTIVIAHPRAEVAAFAVDPDNVTAWYRNITSVRWVSAPPVAVGSRIAFVADSLAGGSSTPTRCGSSNPAVASS